MPRQDNLKCVIRSASYDSVMQGMRHAIFVRYLSESYDFIRNRLDYSTFFTENPTPRARMSCSTSTHAWQMRATNFINKYRKLVSRPFPSLPTHSTFTQEIRDHVLSKLYY